LTTKGTDNIFACLVHERPECVLDLVRNLRCLDPDSAILLYNGSQDAGLLHPSFPWERCGAIVHPHPRPQIWGQLHHFALDCMSFAMERLPFRTLTIVDSDQLAIRRGYSARLTRFLEGRAGVGMIGNCTGPQGANTQISPAQNAHREIELWRPFLRRFRDGEARFVHWSFWPSTVFTAEAARELTRLFDRDTMLKDTMARSKIWATEEIVLPTLAALLGYEIVTSPFSYDYVQYRRSYTVQQLKSAEVRPEIFWVHPVPRVYGDPLRSHVRARFNNYESESQPEGSMPATESRPDAGLLLALPILNRMKQIEGWLAEDEADLLLAATVLALTRATAGRAIVEVGSYCGRSTSVLGSVVKAVNPTGRVYAIDPHNGQVGALDQCISITAPTLERLKRNLKACGIEEQVEPIVACSWEVAWSEPISLLFIDGLHDYANVARDFHHFEPHLVPGGYAAFHDYADYYPGVKTFVNELLKTGRYARVHCVRSMMVVQRLATAEEQPAALPQALRAAEPEPEVAVAAAPRSNIEVVRGPLVSCIMPTANRRALVPLAIQYFQRQDYPDRELIILDDGNDRVEDLVPRDARIRYVGMQEKRAMGAKHNMACAMAQGEIVMHWDDDDWMAARRISYQVNHLLAQPPMTLGGLSRLLYYEPANSRGWEYIYPPGGPGWVCGNTFCYRKSLWEKHHFPERNEGADTAWVWGLRNHKVAPLPDPTFLVAMIHARNTSPKRTHDPRWRSCPEQTIRSLMGEDWDTCRSAFASMQL